MNQEQNVWPRWARILVAVGVIVALVAPLIIWQAPIRLFFAEPRRVAALIRGCGAWGPLMLIGLYLAQAIVAPIPGQALNFAAGYIYGIGLGTLYSWIGQVLGTAAAMLLARCAGRPLVRRLVSPRMLDKLDRLSAGRGLGFFFAVFLIPGLPDDLACYAAGLTSLPLTALLAAGVVGRFPSLVASVWLGAYAGRLSWQGWVVLGLLTLGAVALAWRYGERVQDAVLQRLAKTR